jgi:hypothetical protein
VNRCTGVAVAVPLVLGVALSVGAQDRPLIARLDACLLRRFQTNMSWFGSDRILPKRPVHPPRMEVLESDWQPERLESFIYGSEPQVQKEGEALVKELERQKLELRVGVLHLRPVPNPYSKDESEPFFRPFAQVLLESEELERKVEKQEEALLNEAVLPRVEATKRGKESSLKRQGWSFTIKPIRAETYACLSCHTDAHKGDVLGALVYMIRAKQPSSLALWEPVRQ